MIPNAWRSIKSAVAQVVIYALFLLWLLWMVSCYRQTRDQLRNEKYMASRRRQIGFRFFLWQTCVVIVAEVAIVCVDVYKDWMSRTAMALLMHSYVFLLAYCYAPASGLWTCKIRKPPPVDKNTQLTEEEMAQKTPRPAVSSRTNFSQHGSIHSRHKHASTTIPFACLILHY